MSYLGKEDKTISESWCDKCEKQIIENGKVKGAVCECNKHK